MKPPEGFLEKYLLVDGTSNEYRFYFFSDGAAEFQHRGIRKWEIISGMYDGGPDVLKRLGAAEAAEIGRSSSKNLLPERRTTAKCDPKALASQQFQ